VSIARDQRTALRFPLELGVRYRILREGHISTVRAGRSLDISSGGLFVAPEHQSDVKTGTKLVAFVEWPILLDSTTPLQLFVAGCVVRSDTRGFAVSIHKYQFRTIKMGRRWLAEVPLPRSACDSVSESLVGAAH
jgi:hypothetical protein